MQALPQLGSSAATAWYIGDSTIDALAAEGAGVEFIAVLTGVTTEAELASYEPKAVVRSLSELQGLLDTSRQ